MNQEIIKNFNAVKSLLITRGNKFTKKEFLSMVATIAGMPKYPQLFTQMQPDILYKVFHGNRRAGDPALYSFKDTNPVYYAVLDRIIGKTTQEANKYKKDYYHKKKSESPKVEHINTDVAAAIALLKAHGYKIMKPSVSYEEV